MAYYQYDDRPKTRVEDAAAIEEYFKNGGKISKLPDDKQMRKYTARIAATKRSLTKQGIKLLNGIK